MGKPDRAFGMDEILAEEAVTQLISASGDPMAQQRLLKTSGLKLRGEEYAIFVFQDPLYEKLFFLSEQGSGDNAENREMDLSKSLIKDQGQQRQRAQHAADDPFTHGPPPL